MTPYILVYSIVAICAFFAHNTTSKITKRNAVITFVSFFAVFLLVACRHPSMGVDLGYNNTVGYISSFYRISSMSWTEVIQRENFLNYEKAYIILNKLVSVFSENVQVFLAVIAFISLFPIFYVIYKKSKNPFFSIIIYLGLPTFLFTYSGLRQSIALALCFVSLIYIEEKKIFKFLVFICLAILFHSSAFYFIFAYPLYHVKFNRLARIISIAALPFVYIFRSYIFAFACMIFGVDATQKSTGAFTLFIVFVLIYLLCSIFETEEISRYLNLFYVACLLQSLGGMHNLVLRVGYYYAIVLVLMLPKCFANLKNKKTKLFFQSVTVLSFFLFGLYSIYTSVTAGAYPYYAFWSNIYV